MSQIDDVKRIDGVTTAHSGYGIFYPYDGLLVGDYTTAAEVRDSLESAKGFSDAEFKDAYAVRITVERVDL